MRNILITLMSVTLAVVAGAQPRGSERGAQQTASGPEAYAWAGACKSCHEEIYDAWSRTKHARALGRLGSDDQQKECLGCHVTGPKSKVEREGKLLNGGVQCESCHGTGAAHAADPAVRTGLVRKPSEESCRDCHNSRSPNFKGFVYSAMLSFSHPVRKR
jgi:hypothetical protein